MMELCPPIRIISAVTDARLRLTHGTYFSTKETVQFQLSLDDFGPYTCVLIDFGLIHHSQPLNYLDRLIFGDSITCSNYNLTVSTLRNPLYISRRYILSDSYLVEIDVYDLFDNFHIEQEFVVSDQACLTPNIKIIGQVGARYVCILD